MPFYAAAIAAVATFFHGVFRPCDAECTLVNSKSKRIGAILGRGHKVFNSQNLNFNLFLKIFFWIIEPLYQLPAPPLLIPFSAGGLYYC